MLNLNESAIRTLNAKIVMLKRNHEADKKELIDHLNQAIGFIRKRGLLDEFRATVKEESDDFVKEYEI